VCICMGSSPLHDAPNTPRVLARLAAAVWDMPPRGCCVMVLRASGCMWRCGMTAEGSCRAGTQRPVQSCTYHGIVVSCGGSHLSAASNALRQELSTPLSPACPFLCRPWRDQQCGEVPGRNQVRRWCSGRGWWGPWVTTAHLVHSNMDHPACDCHDLLKEGGAAWPLQDT